MTRPQVPDSALAARTRQWHAAGHELLAQGVGLLECARRLGRALNTVKRYARAQKVEELLRPSRYGHAWSTPTGTWSVDA